MGRQLTGKMHTGQRRETRPNGDVYVYERVTAYDPKTKKTRTVSTKLLGKIPAGKTEMIPTRPKKMKSSDSNPAPEAGRIHAGPAKLLAWMGTASGIDADLRAAFDEGDAKKLISIARYWPENRLTQPLNPQIRERRSDRSLKNLAFFLTSIVYV